MALSDINLDALAPAEALAALEAVGEKRAIEGLGGKVVWRLWGEGQPLVLLHGGYGTWAHWARVIQALARRHRLLVPDMPGFGESDDAPEAGDPETTASRITESLRRSLEPLLDVGERPAICGFSFGGVISGHLAKQLGPRCAKLILTAPGGLGARRGPMPDLVRRTPGMSPQEVEAAHRRNLEILMLADPACVDALALHIQKGNTDQHRVKSRPISATDTLARALEGAPYPVKALWGSLDATAGPYLAEREEILKRAVPGVDFRIEPEAGHWIMYEKPARYVALLEELLEG
jgi:pimeloyl-ACP methyl ester carboxylesterase